MRSFKLPLWTLMVAVLFVGVGFAALKNPTELVASAVFTLTVGLLCVAVLVAIATTGRKRVAWSAFSLFGWVYYFSSFIWSTNTLGIQSPYSLATTLITAGLYYLDVYLTAPNHLPIAPQEMNPNNTDDAPFYFNGYTFKYDRIYFLRVGHCLAAILIGFLAFLVTLLVTAFRREPAKS